MLINAIRMNTIDKKTYRSPSFKVVVTAVNNVICSSPASNVVTNEGLDEELFTW